MSSHNYDRAVNAFRPSVYSTGTQTMQPYDSNWIEGVGYGGFFDWGYNMFTGGDLSADLKAATSTAKSLLASGAAAYQSYQESQAAAEAERKRLEEEHRRNTLLKVGGITLLAVGAFVAVGRYRKHGSVLGARAVA